MFGKEFVKLIMWKILCFAKPDRCLQQGGVLL